MIRNTLSILTAIVVPCCIFVMCRKAGSESSPPQENHYSEIAAKADSWLAGQIARADSLDKPKIRYLKENLDLENAYTEEYGRGQHFIVVPVADNFRSMNNATKKPKNLLLLFVADTGIRKGNIVQLLGDRVSESLPKGIFTSIFNSRSPAFSGTLSFLTIADTRKYDITYKGGALFSHGDIKSKAAAPGNGRTSGCTDFYWVTHYDDGSEDWQYIYTSCTDDCNQTRVANNIAFRVGCNGNGGNGGGSSDNGGGGNQSDECCMPDSNIGLDGQAVSESGTVETLSTGLTTKTKVYEWTFWRAHLGWYNWWRLSLETGTLDNSSGVWKFVSLVHTSDRPGGITPPCVNVKFKMDATNATYAPDYREATMELFFSESIAISCLPGIPDSGTASLPDSARKTFAAE